MALTKDDIRAAAEADIEKFIALVFPQQVLGNVHREVLQWMTRQDRVSHQLLLLPRDHGKSRLAGFYVAWRITLDPTIRVLYISSTSNLAVKQLKFIKDILTSKVYRSYWPDMINLRENDREKWTETEISVDHPKRKAEVVRDPTIFTAGLTTTITGMHCDLAVFDDVVSPDNAYTEEGRASVEAQYSQLASIEGGVAQQLAVGTRYHPLDLYGRMQSIEVETTWDEDGTPLSVVPLYEVFQRAVEDRGDGTGEFLWPVMLRGDGKPFGFDAKILARKRAQYLDRGQFAAQYYNDPNSAEDRAIDPALFQYFDVDKVRRVNGKWHYGNRRLNVFAAVDFAYKKNMEADYTCVVVVGVDGDRNYYVLDIDRFKTELISEYFEHILRAYEKWGFHKIRMETTAAQSIIVKDLKENYIRQYGLALSVDENNPSKAKGTKEERIRFALNPRYENLQMWHYRGGNTQLLEEELIHKKPPHDDIKDCLAAIMDIAVPPAPESVQRNINPMQFHPRFGGVL
jgi:hypothetical protein